MFVKPPLYRDNFEKGVDFELPKFLTREESGVNFNFIKNLDTKSLLDKSNTNRELFKILLASMRSHKKRSSGFFSKELVFHHNELVDKIADYINSFSSIKESTFFSFREFKTVFLGESSSWQEDFGKDLGDDVEITESDIVSINEVSSFIESNTDVIPQETAADANSFPTFTHVSKSQTLDSVKKPLDVLKKLFSSNTTEDSSKKTPVCIIKGKFQPFHNGHLTIIEDACKESGMKVFLIITTKRLADNGFTLELHKEMIEEAIKDNKNVAGYCFSNGRSIYEMLKDLPKKFKVQSFAGSEEECVDMNSQSHDTIMTYAMTKHLSTKNVLQKIKDEDFSGYKKLVPKALWNYFYKIRNEIYSDKEI
jgi:cytidyltransferase-like protein